MNYAKSILEECETHFEVRAMWDAAAGADLRKYRKDVLKWPQGRLAEELGCDQSTVSRIESGDPPSQPIFRLINILRERLPAEAAQ